MALGVALGLACASGDAVVEPSSRARPASAPRPALAGGEGVRVPETRRGEVVEDLHGTRVPDPYRWLEDLDGPETRAWIEAQNAATEGYLEAVPERAALRERLTELWDYARVSTPEPEAGRLFFRRNDELQDQAPLFVLDAGANEPRLLLDPNVLSPDGTISLGATAPSPDGRWLAYALSSGGSDWQEWHVLDVATGERRTDHLRWAKFTGAAWTPDGRGFFYARYPEPASGDELEQQNVGQRLHYHVLGTPQEDDALVFERPDQPTWGYLPHVTDDGRFLVLHVWSGTDRRNRLYYRPLPAEGPGDAALVPLLDDFDARYDFLGNEGDVFYVHTDLDAPRGRVVAIDVTRPAREGWRTVVPERDEGLEQAAFLGGRLVLAYLKDAQSRLRVFRTDGSPERELELPGIGTASDLSGEPGATTAYFSFQSFLDAPEVLQVDLESGAVATWFEPEVPFDASPYETRLLFARSPDGTAVPFFLTARRDLARDGSTPTLLYGYGGFNVSLTPTYAVRRLVWLEMGGAWVQAVLRGGSEYGEAWHQAGMLERKQNVFDDFVAVAEHLVDQRYTSPERLAISGGSNGGLLVGACMTQRPDLFGACLPAVGVLDMLRYHRFTIGWAWVPEYGSADDPEQLPFLLAYSPLHNLEPGTRYPATLITTGDHDDRVVPAHSFKFAAALQAAQGGSEPTLIRVETRAGHGAGKPTWMQIEEVADVLAFLVRALDMELPARLGS